MIKWPASGRVDIRDLIREAKICKRCQGLFMSPSVYVEGARIFPSLCLECHSLALQEESAVRSKLLEGQEDSGEPEGIRERTDAD